MAAKTAKTVKKVSRGIITSTRTAYNFTERDPVFGFVQQAVTESHMSYREIEEAGGACRSTVRNYVMGGSKSGRWDKIMATIRAAGGDVKLILPSGKEMKLGGGK